MNYWSFNLISHRYFMQGGYLKDLNIMGKLKQDNM